MTMQITPINNCRLRQQPRDCQRTLRYDRMWLHRSPTSESSPARARTVAIPPSATDLITTHVCASVFCYRLHGAEAIALRCAIKTAASKKKPAPVTRRAKRVSLPLQRRQKDPDSVGGAQSTALDFVC